MPERAVHRATRRYAKDGMGEVLRRYNSPSPYLEVDDKRVLREQVTQVLKDLEEMTTEDGPKGINLTDWDAGRLQSKPIN